MGSNGKTRYSLSAERTSGKGFDLRLEDGAEAMPGAEDDNQTQRFRLRTITDLNDKTTWEWRVGATHSHLEEASVDPQQISKSHPDRREWFVETLVEYNFSKQHRAEGRINLNKADYNLSWRACYPSFFFTEELRNLYLANSHYADTLISGGLPTGGSAQDDLLLQAALFKLSDLGPQVLAPLCGDANHDLEDTKSSVEFHDWLVISDQLQLVTGLTYSLNRFYSETFTDNRVVENHEWSVFSNLEYKASDKITLNAGLHYEKVSNVQDYYLSPRVSVNYHYLPNHTVRAVYTTATRTPDSMETDRVWQYYARNWSPELNGRTEGYFYLVGTNSQELHAEKIKSYEVGFYGKLFNPKLEYDVRIFNERITDAISEKPAFFSFNLTNNNQVELNGVEMELSYQPTSDIRCKLGYSYIDSSASHPLEESLRANHAGFATAIFDTAIGHLAMAYFGNSKIARDYYDRWDINLSDKLPLKTNASVNWQIGLSYFGNRSVSYERFVDAYVSNIRQSHWQFALTLGMDF